MAARAVTCIHPLSVRAITALLPTLTKTKPFKKQSRHGFWELPPRLQALLKNLGPGCSWATATQLK